MLIFYDGPPGASHIPSQSMVTSMPPPASDQGLDGLGWNIGKHVAPSPGCVNCVGSRQGLKGNSGGISSGITILGLLALVAIGITVVNYSKK